MLMSMVTFPAVLMGQCKLDYSNYHIAFQDNFDTYTSVAEVGNNWKFVEAPGSYDGWGNEYYDQNQVSLQPGGILRLTANRVPSFNDPSGKIDLFNSQVRTLDYVSGKLESKVYLDPGTWAGNPGGFTYGMFEIRCKLPTADNGTWPTFWLYSGPTEIDVIDNLRLNPARELYSNVIDWHGINLSKTNKDDYKYACGIQANKLNWDDLSTGFNTYTVVWTPSRVTFFFNGRESHTIDASQVKTHPHPATIIASLQMRRWSGVNQAQMDIDYIRVYKPNNNNYNQLYKSSSEFVNHNVSAVAPSLPGVHAAAGSLVTNPNNANEVFYRGTDDKLYFAEKHLNNQWSIETLPHSSADTNDRVSGDVTFNASYGIVTYRGYDNHVQFFGRHQGWYHRYVEQRPVEQVNDEPGSLTNAANGDIYFVGQDNKIHRFVGENWIHEVLPYTYGSTGGFLNPADYVLGDIIVDRSSTIFYKGFDNRLQVFFLDGNGVYTHSWIDDDFNTIANTVSAKPYSITIGDNGRIYYIGADDKIHQFVYEFGDWHPSLIPHNYNAPSLGMADADKAKSNIAWDNFHQRLEYGGYDGRIQFFQRYNGSWHHSWVDDYWSTDEFSTFSNIQGNVNRYASLSINSAGLLFYCNKDNQLRYFQYEPCEKLNPVSGSTFNLMGELQPLL